MKLIGWDRSEVPVCVLCMSTTTWLVPPTDYDCLTPQKSDPPPPGLLAAPPGTCQPFTPSLGEHLEGEERQTRRPGWSTDTVTDTAIELSDGFSLFTHQIRTPLPKSAALRVSVAICRHISVSFLSFILLFDRAHRSRRPWCMHSWSWRSRPGNVWFTDPLLTYWFDFSKTWNFNSAGAIEVRLSTFDHGGKPLRICCFLTDWYSEWMWHILREAGSEI